MTPVGTAYRPVDSKFRIRFYSFTSHAEFRWVHDWVPTPDKPDRCSRCFAILYGDPFATRCIGPHPFGEHFHTPKNSRKGFMPPKKLHKVWGIRGRLTSKRCEPSPIIGVRTLRRATHVKLRRLTFWRVRQAYELTKLWGVNR